MEPTDQALVTAYRAGDTAEFEQLMARHLGPVWYFIRRLTRNDEAAHDLTQDVFVKVWRSLDTYDTERRFTTWLYTIARRTVIDWSRKRKDVTFSALTATADSDDPTPESRLADEEPLPDVLVEHRERRALIDAALETLSPLYREVVMLHYLKGLSFAEIASVTKRPLYTVKSQCRRGGIQLRAALETLVHQTGDDLRI